MSGNSYKLVGGDDAFLSRSNKIFSDIDKDTITLPQHKDSSKSCTHKRKVPELNEKDEDRTTQKPSYVVDAKQWTKYDLSNTEASDDRENTQAAFSFLHDLRKRSKPKEAIISTNDGSSVCGGDATMTDMESTDSNPVVKFIKPSVHTMPEHIVGKHVARKKLPISIEKGSSKHTYDKVELDHLEQNISATEFQQEIAGRLEDSIKLRNPSAPVDELVQFKSVNRQKGSKRHVRVRTTDTDND